MDQVQVGGQAGQCDAHALQSLADRGAQDRLVEAGGGKVEVGARLQDFPEDGAGQAQPGRRGREMHRADTEALGGSGAPWL
ncbi:hypothetical protein [Kitasatospora sp. NPDC017646]|uniref:hypothetical protein n=1 Tax=Kitasatospora sp. NPDC017646 TaxID=3364024 RepID=UPI0037B6ECAB